MCMRCHRSPYAFQVARQQADERRQAAKSSSARDRGALAMSLQAQGFLPNFSQNGYASMTPPSPPTTIIHPPSNTRHPPPTTNHPPTTTRSHRHHRHHHHLHHHNHNHNRNPSQPSPATSHQPPPTSHHPLHPPTHPPAESARAI